MLRICSSTVITHPPPPSNQPRIFFVTHNTFNFLGLWWCDQDRLWWSVCKNDKSKTFKVWFINWYWMEILEKLSTPWNHLGAPHATTFCQTMGVTVHLTDGSLRCPHLLHSLSSQNTSTSSLDGDTRLICQYKPLHFKLHRFISTAETSGAPHRRRFPFAPRT